MDKALRLGEIMDLVNNLLKEGKSEEEVRNMICYLGDDEELNGYHMGYCADVLKETDSDYNYVIEDVHISKEELANGIIIIS